MGESAAVWLDGGERSPEVLSRDLYAVGCPSVCSECALLSLVDKKVILANGEAR